MNHFSSTARSRLPGLGRLFRYLSIALSRGIGRFTKSYSWQSAYAQERLNSLRDKLDRGETVLLLGLTPGGHNTGAALVEVSAESGVKLLGNHEEERFLSEKHCQKFPEQSLRETARQLEKMGKSFDDVHAILLGWDYCVWTGYAVESLISELPGSLTLLKQDANPQMHLDAAINAIGAPAKVPRALNLSHRMPVIHSRHHDNHAWFSYAASPFSGSSDPVLIVVVDGAGDDGAISVYRAQHNTIDLIAKNDSFWDSLGMFYGWTSSAMGGWPFGQSEGRFMGAAAWGNMNRQTNPYYSGLREVFHFGNDGLVYLNREFAQWHRKGGVAPFSQRMKELLGEPIPPEKLWDPDAVLNVDEIEHAPITQDRVDQAAAVQLVFEDALFHLVRSFVKQTGSHKLVLTGGTALNCVANMRLMEQFNKRWYNRYLNQPDSQLELWIPPIPNDEGIAAGAAFKFAVSAGAPLGGSDTILKHAFYCGLPPTEAEVQSAIDGAEDMGTISLGNTQNSEDLRRLTDLMAYIISQDGILGIYQGPGETGPRALGHRSFLANPCNPATLETLNTRVKYREKIRPLAPMATLEAAQKYFELSPGASTDDYNAYNYMILTAAAKPIAREEIPAVVHFDNTSRVQIVRNEVDPVCYQYLKAMGRYVGAEVSVNTSLNVGAPICQTPTQALETLRRSKGMHGLVMIAESGEIRIVWHHVETEHKDAGQQLSKWIEEHAEKSQMASSA